MNTIVFFLEEKSVEYIYAKEVVPDHLIDGRISNLIPNFIVMLKHWVKPVSTISAKPGTA